VDHPDLVRVDRRVGGQDVVAHALGHGDDGVRVLDAGALAEARQGVAAAELLALPGAQRLQAVGGDHVGDVVDQLGEVAGQVRVPGVAVHEVDAGDPGGDQQVGGDGPSAASSGASPASASHSR
jgi:hypothetical protein